MFDVSVDRELRETVKKLLSKIEINIDWKKVSVFVRI